MMKKKRSLKEIEKFWKSREKNRELFDRERSSADFSEKARIAARLRSDFIKLKRCKIISPKP